MRVLGFAICLACLTTLARATEWPVEDRIRARAASYLVNQPNYTCLQTVTRSERRKAKGKFRKRDSIRLEVALIEGKEVFSWPGARQFDVEDIREIVPSGVASTGSFALHARTVFLLGIAEWTAAGREDLSGVSALKYAYRIPADKSQYWLRTHRGSAIVGQSGHFWVNAETLDLMRIEVNLEGIPEAFEVKSAAERVDYSRVRIGSGAAVLPVFAVTTLITSTGAGLRNKIEFRECRQYVGESVISFETAPP